jgi:Tol biopolymer transport system component
MLRGRGSNRMGVWTVLLMLALMMAAPGLAGAATVELISGTDISGTNTVADSFGTSAKPALSADGRYVAFLSDAANLVPGQEDENEAPDVFLHDRLLGTTTLVSHVTGSPARAASPGGDSLDYDSLGISADGRYVAFSGQAKDLAPGAGDNGNLSEVFLWDRVTGTTTLVSHAAGSPGTAANGSSSGVHISADGNFLVFLSRASNLAAGQAEPTPNLQTADVFLWSRASDTITLVSRQNGTTATVANQGSSATAISADGGVVLFTTLATNLLSTVIDVNTSLEVYAYQRSTDTLSLVSRSASAPQSAAGATFGSVAVSADGRYVAFSSNSDDIVPGHVDEDIFKPDAILYDRTTGEMRLASHRSASPFLGGGIFDPSTGIAMSADGRYIAFSSAATDLVPGQVDTNQTLDVFVYDRVTGLTALASHSRDSVTRTGAAVDTSTPSGSPAFSTDGRFLAFQSVALDLVPGQTDIPGTADVFLYDQTSRSVTLMSHPRASDSTTGNTESLTPVLSADGGVAAFLSGATNLGEGQTDPYGFLDLFLYHRTSGEITSPSRNDPSLPPPLTPTVPSFLGGFSANGRFAIYQSPRIDALDHLFLRDAVTDTTTRLSTPFFPPYTDAGQNPLLSADGRFAASLALVQSGPGFAVGLYLYDRTAGTFTLVNHAPGSAAQLDGSASRFALSADGRYVAYQCSACGLVPGHSTPPGVPRFQEIFLYDRLSGLNTLISRAANTSVPELPADSESYSPAISADGRYVVFWSFATNLVPGQVDVAATQDLFVFDRETGETSLVSHVPGYPATAAGLRDSLLTPVELSANGRFIAFHSTLPNLVPGQVDAKENADVFLHDQFAGTTVLVSHAASSPVTVGNGPSQSFWSEDSLSMSADGRFLVYESLSTDLVAGAEDTNGHSDIFLYDRLTGTSSLVSHAGGAPLRAGDGASQIPRISADGSHIAFLSGAVDLVPGQPVLAGWYNLYVQNRNQAGGAGTTTFVGRAFRISRPFDPFPTDYNYDPLSFAPQVSADGRRIAFHSEAALVPGDYNGLWDVYLWDEDGTVEPEGPVAVPPCRLLDTRRRAERPILTSNVRRTVTAQGRCAVPATARQVVVKVTVFNPSGKGNLRFYPGAVTATPSGILRFERRTGRTETFTLPLGADGKLTILPFVAGRGTVHGVVEVIGYSQSGP